LEWCRARRLVVVRTRGEWKAEIASQRVLLIVGRRCVAEWYWSFVGISIRVLDRRGSEFESLLTVLASLARATTNAPPPRNTTFASGLAGA
jgi:hypothetical protein